MTTYYRDKELPGQPWTVYESDGVTIAQLASGWTAKIQVIRVSNAHLVIEQSTDIVLANTAPNLVRSKWAAATLAAIVTDMGTETTVDYIEHPVLVRTSDSADEGIGSDDPVVHTFKAVPV
jgi:hypothetical protein